MTPKFQRGDCVCKVKGSQWRGVVVGTYSTNLTPEGYAVESHTEKGSVQIYPAAALEMELSIEASPEASPEARGWSQVGAVWTHPSRPGESWSHPEGKSP